MAIDFYDILGIKIIPKNINPDEVEGTLNQVDIVNSAIADYQENSLDVDSLFDVTESIGLDMDIYVEGVLENLEMVEKYGSQT
jgi:hypothetical protein